MSSYKPPYHLTHRMINLIAEIGEQLGQFDVLFKEIIGSTIRHKNRIRTIHASLAIEHNSLSLEQVSAIIEGKHFRKTSRN